jgi:hypothetical protein
MKIQYSYSRTEYGWLICQPPGQSGIPLDAMDYLQKLAPKKSVIAGGIAHFYKNDGQNAVLAVADNVKAYHEWQTEINEDLDARYKDSAQRWWHGLDVGMSAATIFSVLVADDSLKVKAGQFAREAVPHDADDFGRCVRLIQRMPEWKPRLQEVADKYPNTKWPKVLGWWDQLCSMPPAEQTKILSAL